MMSVETGSTKDFAMLAFDQLRLCFPQDQVLNIELVGSLEQNNSIEPPVVGCLMNSGIEVPAYSLSEDFSLTTNISEERQNCVCFHNDGQALFALVCNSVEPLQCDDSMKVLPLPESMATDKTPVHALIKLENNLLYICQATAISEYLGVTDFMGGGKHATLEN